MSANAADRDRTSATDYGTVARSIVANCWRTLLDFVVLGIWTGFLGAVFLYAGHPRWAYYVLLLLGVVLYTQLSEGWARPDEVDGDDAESE